MSMTQIQRRGTALLAALSLAGAPAAAAPAVAPADERVEGSEMRGGVYWALPVLILIALLIAILHGDGTDAEPASP